MVAAIQFILNGRTVSIEKCSPNTTLLEFLRGASLTGAKEGCAEGDCGACSVALVDRDAQGRPCYRAINSCLVPVCLMAGREIVSVEGVANSELRTPILRPKATEGRPNSELQNLHPVQRKMVEGHGSQCGYCTPGVIMSLFEGYYRDIHKHDELDDQLSGNLCRCTGYRPIRDAAIEAFSFRSSRRKWAQNKTQNQSKQTDVCCYEDTFAERLKKAGAGPDGVEYNIRESEIFPANLAGPAFESAPAGSRRAARCRRDGTSPSGSTKRFKRFPTLISVEAVPELNGIKSTETEWHIGAAATLTQIEEKMAGEFPALGDMLRVFGSRQIRNRATMGGNLVTASPIGDSAPVLLALDAKVVIVAQASSLCVSETKKTNSPARCLCHYASARCP